MLTVRDLDLFYGDAQALDRVSLEVPKGAIVAIVGANGAGKTSLIRTIAGMHQPARGRILFLPVEDIRWIEAEENYVRVCTGGESHLLREAIGHMETQLDPETFLRVHRSFIVNLHYVKEVKNEPDGDAIVLMVTGEKIAMSRSYRSRIHKLMKA